MLFKWSRNIIIKIFHKLPDITIRDAIRQQFINQLADEALANCQVKRISDRLVLLSEQITLEISPTGDYALKIDEEIKNGRKDYGCGDYGAVISGERYFVFHPDEDMKKFAFIQMPQNKSLFDRDSIILFSPLETHAPSGSITPSVKSSQWDQTIEINCITHLHNVTLHKIDLHSFNFYSPRSYLLTNNSEHISKRQYSINFNHDPSIINEIK